MCSNLILELPLSKDKIAVSATLHVGPMLI